MHVVSGETAEERQARGLGVTAALIRSEAETPTVATYERIYAQLGLPAPTLADLRADGLPVRDLGDAA